MRAIYKDWLRWYRPLGLDDRVTSRKWDDYDRIEFRASVGGRLVYR